MTAEVCTHSAVKDMSARHGMISIADSGPLYTPPQIQDESLQMNAGPREKVVEEGVITATEEHGLARSQQVEETGEDEADVCQVKELITFFERGVDIVTDTIDDAIGDAGHFIEYAAKKLAHRHSQLGEPENNVHIIHPVSNTIVALGLHITEHPYGCNAFRVIEEGLASKFKVEHGDVIRKINGRDLRNLKIEEIINIFSTLDITKTIILRVVRMHEDENGKFTLYEFDVTINIKVSEDTISFEIDAVVTATYLRYQSSTDPKYIAQTQTDESAVYMRVDGRNAEVSPELDGKCHFKMELYQGGARGQRVCVIRNVTSSRVITKAARNSRDLDPLDAPEPRSRKIVANPDNKFFYWIDHPFSEGESVFRSVLNDRQYIAVTAEGALCLKSFRTISDVDETGRFGVIDV